MTNINETVIEYVLYEREKNNAFIQSMKKFDPSIKKVVRTKNGVIMEDFYDFSKYKNVKNLQELSDALLDNEYLIVVLNNETRTLVDPDNIITYVSHEPEQKESNRQLGEKLYLVHFEDIVIKGMGKALDELVVTQIKKNADGTYDIEGIGYTSMSKKELNDILAIHYGDLSGVYYLTTNKELLEKHTDDYYEATKVGDCCWDIIKLAKQQKK